MKALTRMINVKLKTLLVFLAIQLSMTACTSATVKKKRPEIWLIDTNEAVLYRVISDKKEQALPIKGNREAKRFMCVHQSQVDSFVEEMVNAEFE